MRLEYSQGNVPEVLFTILARIDHTLLQIRDALSESFDIEFEEEEEVSSGTNLTEEEQGD